MNNYKIILLSLTTILTISANETRSQALRFNTLSYVADFKTELNLSSATFKRSNWFVGIGYEHNIGERVAVSLDIIQSLGAILGSENAGSNNIQYFDQANSSQSSYTFSRISYISYSGLNYQCKFFFSENDDASTYISSGIGLKFVKWYLKPTSSISEVPQPLFAVLPTSIVNENKLIIPLSIRFGRRGSIDDVFGDIFIGVSYNLAANKFNENKYFKNIFNEDPMRKLAFNIGYSFGFGWAN